MAAVMATSPAGNTASIASSPSHRTTLRRSEPVLIASALAPSNAATIGTRSPAIPAPALAPSPYPVLHPGQFTPATPPSPFPVLHPRQLQTPPASPYAVPRPVGYSTNMCPAPRSITPPPPRINLTASLSSPAGCSCSSPLQLSASLTHAPTPTSPPTGCRIMHHAPSSPMLIRPPMAPSVAAVTRQISPATRSCYVVPPISRASSPSVSRAGSALLAPGPGWGRATPPAPVSKDWALGAAAAAQAAADVAAAAAVGGCAASSNDIGERATSPVVTVRPPSRMVSFGAAPQASPGGSFVLAPAQVPMVRIATASTMEPRPSSQPQPQHARQSPPPAVPLPLWKLDQKPPWHQVPAHERPARLLSSSMTPPAPQQPTYHNLATFGTGVSDTPVSNGESISPSKSATLQSPPRPAASVESAATSSTGVPRCTVAVRRWQEDTSSTPLTPPTRPSNATSAINALATRLEELKRQMEEVEAQGDTLYAATQAVEEECQRLAKPRHNSLQEQTPLPTSPQPADLRLTQSLRAAPRLLR